MLSAHMQSLSEWITANPHWALLITFFIAFSESILIIGTLVPGSVTMTAIGILAGSGVMRIDLTLLAAILGAIGGDSVSYFIGYWYRDNLVNIWPFSRYPQILNYGKIYFTKHGGKSVLIGRFAGPLRAIIPVIAGMMHMPQLKFILANVISAIGWSILYLMPGVLIGTASAQLSAEVATKLFVYVLIGILSAWLAGIILRWLIRKLNYWLEKNLHYYWRFAARHSILNRLVLFITPEDEKNHYSTVLLLIVSLLSVFALIILTLLIYQAGFLLNLDRSLFYFFQSLRTDHFDWFFSIISMFYSPLTLILLAVTVALTAVVIRQYRLLLYWIILIFSTLLLAGVFYISLSAPSPFDTGFSSNRNFYPGILLSLMIALLWFSSLMCVHKYRTLPSVIYTYIYGFLILFACLSSLYFNDLWLSDVLASLFTGTFTSVTAYILYRSKSTAFKVYKYTLPLFLLWIAAALFSNIILLKSFVADHKLIYPEKALSMEEWWDSTKGALPMYRKNRLGRAIAPFNIQMNGSLFKFRLLAEKSGWKFINTSFFQLLVNRLSHNPDMPSLPIFNQLYLNKKPSLTMVKQLDNRQYLLQFWQSNFYIQSKNTPVYLGSLYPLQEKHRIKDKPDDMQHKRFKALLQETLVPMQYCFMVKSLHLKNMPSNAAKSAHTHELQLKIRGWDKNVPLKIYIFREKVSCL